MVGLRRPELLAEGGTTGNYGTLDQIEALRFVKQNIRAWGGDPSRVAVFGQSSGGMSVCALLLNPAVRSERLISAAIIESGPATGRLGTDPYAANTLDEAFAMGRDVARQVGCSHSAPNATSTAAIG